jgi:hypothetical protein
VLSPDPFQSPVARQHLSQRRTGGEAHIAAMQASPYRYIEIELKCDRMLGRGVDYYARRPEIVGAISPSR